MKKLTKLILLAFIFCLGSNYVFARVPKPKQEDPQTIIPNLIAEKQQTKMWCWAASIRMLVSSKTQNIPTQCEMASTVFKQDCCANPKSLKCVQGQHISDALNELGYESIDKKADINLNEHWSRRVDNKGWYQKVVNSIKNGNPVIVSRYNSAGTMDSSAHAVVVYGTYNRKGKDYLMVFDPWEGMTKFWDSTYVTGFMAWILTTTLK